MDMKKRDDNRIRNGMQDVGQSSSAHRRSRRQSRLPRRNYTEERTRIERPVEYQAPGMQRFQRMTLFRTWIEQKFGQRILQDGPVVEVDGKGEFVKHLNECYGVNGTKGHLLLDNTTMQKIWKHTKKVKKTSLTLDEAQHLFMTSAQRLEEKAGLMRKHLQTGLLIGYYVPYFTHVEAIVKFAVDFNLPFVVLLERDYTMNRQNSEERIAQMLAVEPGRMQTSQIDFPHLVSDDCSTHDLLYRIPVGWSSEQSTESPTVTPSPTYKRHGYEPRQPVYDRPSGQDSTQIAGRTWGRKRRRVQQSDCSTDDDIGGEQDDAQGIALREPEAEVTAEGLAIRRLEAEVTKYKRQIAKRGNELRMAVDKILDLEEEVDRLNGMLKLIANIATGNSRDGLAGEIRQGNSAAE